MREMVSVKRQIALAGILVVLTMLAPTASAQTIPWQYSENYTKVTVAGQTYDNYLVLIKDGNSFYLHNVATDLLQSLHPQGIVTPDRMFANSKELTLAYVEAISKSYPQKEVVAINYAPWQETEFVDAITGTLPEAYAAFAGDANHNGYAYDVFVHNVPFEQAQRAFVPLVSLPVYTKLANVYTDSAVYEADGNTSAYSGNAMYKVTIGNYGYHMNSKQIGEVRETGESYAQPTEAGDGLPNPEQVTDGVDFFPLEQAPLLAQNAYDYPVAFYGLARDFLALDTIDINPDSHVVVLIRGWMSSTGYDINVQGVTVDGHTLTVTYETKVPGPDEFCGTAMTYVYEVVELKNFAPQHGTYFIVTKPAEKPPVTPGNGDSYVLPMPLVARLTVGDSKMQMANGNLTDEIVLPIAPCKLNGTTVVPVRAFVNAFNALVDYQPATGQIRISRGTTGIQLTIGSDAAMVNGQQVQMGVKAQFIRGNLVAPLRTIAQALGAEVKYEQATEQIVVYLHNWEDKALR